MSFYSTPSTEYQPSFERLLPPASPYISATCLESTSRYPTLRSPFTPGLTSSNATSPTSMAEWSPYTASGSFTDSTVSSPSFTSPAHSVVGKQQRRKTSSPVVVHPYARLEAKKSQEKQGVKRRKVWDHLLEKRIFSAEELSTIKAQDRRKIYVSSLESHVDGMHAHLLSVSLYPTPFERLDSMSGLHSKTAMSMIASVLHDTQEMKLKLLELERTNRNLRIRLQKGLQPNPEAELDFR